MTYRLRVTVTEISEAIAVVEAPDLETAKAKAEEKARGGALLYRTPIKSIEIEEAS